MLPTHFKKNILNDEGENETREESECRIKIEMKTGTVNEEHIYETNYSENMPDDGKTKEVC